jgi:50S ribosomal subunit-associated GTPase HflX
MDLGRIPQLLVFNKADLVKSERRIEFARRYRALAISALKGEGLEELSLCLQEMIFRRGKTQDQEIVRAGIQPSFQREDEVFMDPETLGEVPRDGTGGP